MHRPVSTLRPCLLNGAATMRKAQSPTHASHRKRYFHLYTFAFFLVANAIILLAIESRWHPSASPPAALAGHATALRNSVAVPSGDTAVHAHDAAATSRQPIPKKIHMTWKSASVPSWAQHNVQTWKTKNPDYEWILHTDADMDAYIREKHPELVVVWDKLIVIQKADFFRYIIVMDEGGVYADLDVTCVKPIEKWTSELREFANGVGLIVGFEAVVGQKELDLHYFARKFQIAQWVFAAAKNHPVLQNVIRIIVNKLTPMSAEEIASSSVIRTTGPVSIHAALHTAMLSPGRFIRTVLSAVVTKLVSFCVGLQAVWSDAVAEYLDTKFGVVLGEEHPDYGKAFLRERVQGTHTHIGDVLLLPEVRIRMYGV